MIWNVSTMQKPNDYCVMLSTKNAPFIARSVFSKNTSLMAHIGFSMKYVVGIDHCYPSVMKLNKIETALWRYYNYQSFDVTLYVLFCSFLALFILFEQHFSVLDKLSRIINLVFSPISLRFQSIFQRLVCHFYCLPKIRIKWEKEIIQIVYAKNDTRLWTKLAMAHVSIQCIIFKCFF